MEPRVSSGHGLNMGAGGNEPGNPRQLNRTAIADLGMNSRPSLRCGLRPAMSDHRDRARVENNGTSGPRSHCICRLAIISMLQAAARGFVVGPLAATHRAIARRARAALLCKSRISDGPTRGPPRSHRSWAHSFGPPSVAIIRICQHHLSARTSLRSIGCSTLYSPHGSRAAPERHADGTGTPTACQWHANNNTLGRYATRQRKRLGGAPRPLPSSRGAQRYTVPPGCVGAAATRGPNTAEGRRPTTRQRRDDGSPTTHHRHQHHPLQRERDAQHLRPRQSHRQDNCVATGITTQSLPG